MMPLSPDDLALFVPWDPSARRVRTMAKASVHVLPPPRPNRKPYPFVGTIVFQGMAIYVENMKGDVRSGTDPNGTPWEVTMPAHYGEFAETRGNDGDAIDVYVGPNPLAEVAYVVHQKIPGTEIHDEDKVMLGFDTAADAEACYKSAYTIPGFFGGMTPWPVSELRSVLHAGSHRRLDRNNRTSTLAGDYPAEAAELPKKDVGP